MEPIRFFKLTDWRRLPSSYSPKNGLRQHHTSRGKNSQRRCSLLSRSEAKYQQNNISLYKERNFWDKEMAGIGVKNPVSRGTRVTDGNFLPGRIWNGVQISWLSRRLMITQEAHDRFTPLLGLISYLRSSCLGKQSSVMPHHPSVPVDEEQALEATPNPSSILVTLKARRSESGKSRVVVSSTARLLLSPTSIKPAEV